MAKLESLIVDLQLDSAELKKGLEEVKHALKETGEAAEGLLNFEVLKEVGHLALEAAEKLGEFALQGAETADKMGKMAQSVGISVETFSRLNYAAALSKLSTEEFGNALGKLNIKIATAASGNKDAANLFHVLGVSVKDATGATRSADQVIGDLAGVFSGLKDGAAKGTLAVDLFGKAGKQLIPFLNEGKEGIARLSDEADRFGITVSSKTVAAATEFNDNIEKMKKVVEGVGVQLAAQLAPALERFTNEMLNSKAGAEGLKDAVTVLATALKILVSVGVVVAGVFEYVGTALAGGVASAVAALTGDFASANEITKEMQKDLAETSENMGKRLDAVWNSVGDASEKAAETNKKSADSMIRDLDRLKKAADEMEQRFREAQTLAHRLTEEHFAQGEAGVRSGEVARQGAQTRQQFQNIGAPQMDVINQAIGHFKDFDAALTNYTAATEAAIKDQERVNELKKGVDVEAFDEALAVLDSDKQLAERAKEAVGGFTELAKMQADALNNMASFLESAAVGFASKLGAFGDVVSAAAQGFQSGGVWGALIAALVELFTKFSRFGELIDHGNALIQDLLGSMGEGLGYLTTALHSLLNGIGGLLNAVGSLLNGPLHGVGILFDHIGKLLSGVMDGLGPALDALGGILDAVMSLVDILDPMKPVITILGVIFKVVGIALLELNRGIMLFIAQILESIRSFLSSVGLDDMALAVSKVEIKLKDGADAAGKKAEQMWDDVGHTFDDMGKDNSLQGRGEDVNTDITDAAGATTDGLNGLGDSAKKTSTALNKLTEQFTNLPSGFKVRLRSFQAMDTDSLPGQGFRDQKAEVHIHASGGVTTTIDQLLKMLEEAMEKKGFQRGGFGPR